MKFIYKIILFSFLATCLLLSCKKDFRKKGEPDFNSIRSGDTIIHKLNVNGHTNIIKQVGNTFFYASDIILSKEQFNALKRMTLSGLGTVERSTIVQDFRSTWPNAIAYYRYPDPSTMSASDYETFVNAINIALTTIADSTSIQFIQQTTQPEYIQFVKHPSQNNSPLGWQKDRVNTVNVYSYNSVGIIMHEILHSLGVMHEQSRPDRDNFIVVDTSKVADGYEYNFNIYPNYIGNGQFDFESLMLYSSFDFAKYLVLPTMTRLNGTPFFSQRETLSTGDVSGLKNLYFPFDDGVYRISPVYLNTKSFGVSNSATADGTKIVLYSNDNAANQKFIVRKNWHGYVQLKSMLDTTKVLTASSYYLGANIEIKSNSQSGTQKFKIYNLGNGNFSFSLLPGSRIEVSGAGTANLTPIVLGSYNANSEAQIFKLSKIN